MLIVIRNTDLWFLKSLDKVIPWLYPWGMKTAISIPQEVFKSAEKLADKMGVSRSQLYATAIKSFVEAHEGGAITHKLNEVYGNADSGLDPKLKKLQAKAISRNSW